MDGFFMGGYILFLLISCLVREFRNDLLVKWEFFFVLFFVVDILYGEKFIGVF